MTENESKKLREPLEYNLDNGPRFDRVRYDPATYEPLKTGESPVRLRVLFDDEDALTYVGEERATSEKKSAEALVAGVDKGAWLSTDDVRWLHRQLGALILKWDGEKTAAGLRECIGAYGERGDVILFTEETIAVQVFANETTVIDEVTRRSGIEFPAENDEEQAERDKHGNELWKSDDALWKKLRARAEWRAAGLFTKSRAQFDKWRMDELEAAAKETPEPAP